MEIQIIKEKDNPFFNRKDLVLSIKHAGTATPKTAEVKKDLAEKYSVHDSQVVVDFIMSKRGLQESEAKVKILNERPPVVEEEAKTAEETPIEEKTTEEPEEPAAKEKPAAETKPPEPAKEEPRPKEEQKPETKEEKKEDEA